MENDFAQFAADCRDAGPDLEHLSVWQEAQQKALKSRFNVFTAVLKYDDEVKLHSRWLHHLLNPKAEHDCGTLFLNLFIQTLRKQGAQRHDGPPNHELDKMNKLAGFDGKTATVVKEKHTDFGYIDIHIESPWGLIVVENKTRLRERTNQIRDYAEYCVQYRKDSRKDFILLFLTPEGCPAQSADNHKNEYRRISYRNHILPWLEECLRATYQYVHINQALQQYKNVVNQLLNLGSDSVYMEEFTEILKKYPAIIKHSVEINQAVEIIQTKYWKDFVPELRKQLGDCNIILGEEELDGRNPYCYLEPSHASWRSSLPQLKTTLEYDVSKHCLCIGESLSVKEFQGKTRTFDDLIKRLVAEFSVDSMDYNRGGDPINWPLGWAEFQKGFLSPNFLAENAAQKSGSMHDQVADVVKVISQYFKVLEGPWLNATA